MFRWLIAILLIIVGVVGIAGGIWGFSLQASSDVSPELVNAAQTVLEYADEAENRITEWTNGIVSLTGIMNNLIGGEVDLSDDTSVQLFVMVHALEVLLCGIIGLETGLLMIKFRRS